MSSSLKTYERLEREGGEYGQVLVEASLLFGCHDFVPEVLRKAQRVDLAVLWFTMISHAASRMTAAELTY